MSECIIHPPLRGQWTIYNPPGHPKQAYDFLAVNEHKSLYTRGGFFRHALSFISVSDTLTWGQSVYAPVGGKVIAAHDGEADRMKISFIFDLFRLLLNQPKASKGFAAFGGNYIVIKFEQFYVLLCHLKKDSVLVKEGDEVEEGVKLAEVGNSGSSIQPHLHLQVMHNSNIFPLFQNLVSFKFSTGMVKEDSRFVTKDNFSLNNRAHYNFTK